MTSAKVFRLNVSTFKEFFQLFFLMAFLGAVFLLALELKSQLELDIFPNYNFPLDEWIREHFWSTLSI